jgi:hypothetical protein
MDFTTDHPEGLFCPICGCGEIHYWPELIDWNKWSDKKKRSYESCPACGYHKKPSKPMHEISFERKKRK